MWDQQRYIAIINMSEGQATHESQVDLLRVGSTSLEVAETEEEGDVEEDDGCNGVEAAAGAGGEADDDDEETEDEEEEEEDDEEEVEEGAEDDEAVRALRGTPRL